MIVDLAIGVQPPAGAGWILLGSEVERVIPTSKGKLVKVRVNVFRVP